MSRLFIFLLFLGFQSMVIGQTPVLVALEGTVQDFVTGKKLFGATVNVIQNGVSVSRVVSDNKGYYYVRKGQSNSDYGACYCESRLYDEKNVI
jgi:hypothetical protein